jgi:hypothetical protein
VPEPVGPETLDAGALSAPAQGPHESFAAELLATGSQPEVWLVGEGVLRTLVEVDQQRLGGGLADRDDPAARALAAASRDPSGDEVEVIELQVDDLVEANRGLDHEPDDGLVTAV